MCLGIPGRVVEMVARVRRPAGPRRGRGRRAEGQHRPAGRAAAARAVGAHPHGLRRRAHRSRRRRGGDVRAGADGPLPAGPPTSRQAPVSDAAGRAGAGAVRPLRVPAQLARVLRAGRLRQLLRVRRGRARRRRAAGAGAAVRRGVAVSRADRRRHRPAGPAGPARGGGVLDRQPAAGAGRHALGRRLDGGPVPVPDGGAVPVDHRGRPRRGSARTTASPSSASTPTPAS